MDKKSEKLRRISVKLLDGMKDLFDDYQPSNFEAVFNTLSKNIHNLPAKEKTFVIKNFPDFFDIYIQEIRKVTGDDFKPNDFNSSVFSLPPPILFGRIVIPLPIQKGTVDFREDKTENNVFYEVNDGKGEYVIIFEVPGISRKDINFNFNTERNSLILSTHPRSPRCYSAEVPLKNEIDISIPPFARLMNGMLELRLKKK